MNGEIYNFLQRIQLYTSLNLIKFNGEIRINSIPKEYEISYYVPPEKDCFLLEGKWGGVLAFSILPLEDMIFLLFAILLETPIIFISTDICLLTATM